MVTNKKILKIIDGIEDKEVKEIFTKERGFSSVGRRFPPEFMRAHEQTLRLLLPTYYDEMLQRYDEEYESVYDVDEFLIEYICQEYKIIDYNVLESVEEVGTINTSYRAIIKVRSYKQGLKNGSFTAKDVLVFTQKNPKHLDFFLPLLADSDDKEVWATLSQYVQEAKLEDSLRIEVLSAMLRTKNPSSLAYFLDEIEKNNYYRLKALNEAVIRMSNYTSALPPKEAVAILRDALKNEQTKYLGKGYKQNLCFIKCLARISQENYDQYIRLVITEGTPRAKQAALESLESAEINKYADIIFNAELSLEDVSFFHYRIKCRLMDKSVLLTTFYTFLALLDSMSKVTHHFKTDDDVQFARDVSKGKMIRVLANAAMELKEEKYFALLDARYDGLKEEAQAEYLEIVGNRTKLDRRACAIRFLKTENYEAVRYYNKQNIILTYDEAVGASDYLKSKRESIKTDIIKTFLASPDKEKIMDYLLQAKEEYKVLAGKEMQKSLGNVEEEKLKEVKPNWLYREPCVFKIEKPTAEIETLAAQSYPIRQRKGITLERLKGFFDGFAAFVEKHKDYEYQAHFEDGLVTYGSQFTQLKSVSRNEKERFSNYPLGEELKAWMQEALTEEEYVSLLFLYYFWHVEDKKYYSQIYGKSSVNILDETDKIYEYMREKWVQERNSYWVTSSVYRRVQKLFLPILLELISEKTRIEMALIANCSDIPEPKKGEGILSTIFLQALGESNDIEVLKILAHVASVRLQKGGSSGLNAEMMAKLLENKLVSTQFIRHVILNKIWLRELTDPKNPLCLARSDHPYPAFKEFILAFIQEGIDAELTRGSLSTPYTTSITSLKVFYGVKNYVRSIAAIRGLTLMRSPCGGEKNDSISKIMKYCVKAEGDTYEEFVSLLEEYKITRAELIRATLFNPSFIDYAAKYLAIPHFRLAVYYFIAHLNEALYGEEQERRIETLKEFSDINYLDFQDGAFDYNWYQEMVEKVPEADLKLIYDNAKYVTVGGLHKRAQRFFDAMNGKIDKEECLEKIKGTRNKDYCLIYSLIPIQDKEDLTSRYLLLQDFLKESKKYGAQRQLSERRTVDIALENLARAAGYADANIFIFEMEAENAVDIFKTHTVGEVEITPTVDERNYKVGYAVMKNGKKLSSIPSKYGKDETVVYLKERIKELNQKFRRVIKSFEGAMVNRVPFKVEQLKNMSREKTIETVLSKLLFLANGQLALFKNGVLQDLAGGEMQAEEVYVAHPIEMKKAEQLGQAIEYVVKNNVKQPFKQALREIYPKAKEELEQEEVLRYKGFSVDLKKCIAALKGNGWGISEDIGLRKVYYRSNTVAALFRKFDEFYTFDFENVNRELHGLFFLDRKTEEIIPLKDVDDITFSETLRDVDLMITISANVIYDYDLAKSTVEIRHEILKSIVSLLALDNVSFLKDNISIKGAYGTYLVNIRTGLVFKEGKGNLLLDTVYSTDKALLLDFIDEDPMTADIISKAVVLSNDQTIRDPAILREIKD